MRDNTLADRYILKDPLGTGSQGQVYRAVDKKLGRTVAVKLMQRGFGQGVSDDEARQRFRREAKLTVLFEHPYVVKLFDCDTTDDGLPFLVMEHLDGHTLDQLDEPLSGVEVQLLVRQVCAALQHAHDGGLVHRDLKPANIMLVDRGKSEQRFVILDLGIAKLTELTAPGFTTLAQMTMCGAGTPQYMSPEQVHGKPVDHRSDVFSLGCILFELLAARPVFFAEGKPLWMLFDAIVGAPTPSLCQLAPDRHVPAALDELIQQCLAKEPDDRPDSMQDVAERFLAAFEGRPATNTGAALATVRPDENRSRSHGTVGRRSISAQPRRRSDRSSAKKLCKAALAASLLVVIGLFLMCLVLPAPREWLVVKLGLGGGTFSKSSGQERPTTPVDIPPPPPDDERPTPKDAPNTAFELVFVDDQVVNEGQVLELELEVDGQPDRAFDYQLSAGRPQGMSIDTNSGRLIWTPDEEDGPGEFSVTVLAVDPQSGAVLAERSFDVRVHEVNRAPELNAIADQTLDYGNELRIDLRADDADLPRQACRIELGPESPQGARIDVETGSLIWKPDHTVAPGTHCIEVLVSDDGSPPKTAAHRFEVTYRIPLSLRPISSPIIVAEGTTLSLRVAAHPQFGELPLRFALRGTVPDGASIDAATGLLTWQPTESQGPGTYKINVAASLATHPEVVAETYFLANVREANQPPRISAIEPKTVAFGEELRFSVAAVDSDLPRNRLSFAFERGAPPGATLNAATGEFRWKPDVDVQTGQLDAAVRVTDNGVPALSTVERFRIDYKSKPPATPTRTTTRPNLGVFLQTLDKPTATRLGLTETQGVLIDYVIPGMAAERVGLQQDDVVLRIDGEKMFGARQVGEQIREYRTYAVMRFEIWRANRKQHVNVKFDETDYGGTSEAGNRQLRSAAEKGDVRAQRAFAYKLNSGTDLDQDPVEAARWLRKAADHGDAEAMAHLADAFLHGRGVARNASTALQWLRKAAAGGSTDAHFQLGKFYRYGPTNERDDFKAFSSYLKAAGNDHRVAQLEVALMYGEGIGVEKNEFLGFHWMKRSAEAEIAIAQGNLALSYLVGKGVGADNSLALQWAWRSERNGDRMGAYVLGRIYAQAKGVGKNIERAEEWFRKAAEKGEVRAEIELGRICENEKQDYTEAAKWYRKAAVSNDERAAVIGQHFLAKLYQRGRGVERDAYEYVKWLRKAADGGFASAQKDLGVCYQRGEGVTQNYRDAHRWFLKAAEAGNPMAQYALGDLYRRGLGVSRNMSEAVKWYRIAAVAGFAPAQANLGNAYRLGDGVKQDFREAAKWLRLAAEQGHAEAQNTLGILNVMGQGVARDPQEAARWFRKAADQGHSGARENLTKVLREELGG